ncbi:hypothetical protein EYF80_058473 [Liparis tanakae]|uniref:Uncharacterized protein n=1 Tax=Liparis tanakae TaxID=230148 RepID=A0A4Z2ER40_9TELE|nr:hypothetical protein EYF80_058473 [Liparis tanakae]
MGLPYPGSHRPTRKMQRPVSRKATRTPTHMSVENGASTLKPLSSEAESVRSRKLMPVCMKGVVMSTAFSLVAVRVSGATARLSLYLKPSALDSSEARSTQKPSSSAPPPRLMAYGSC